MLKILQIFVVLLAILLLIVSPALALKHGTQSGGAVATQNPGPSQALFNTPYYSCVRNFYVATAANGGSNSNDGTAPVVGGGHGPWLTIQFADTSSRVAGDCVNITPGTYASGLVATHGGSTATSTGYVVYRCTTLLGCIITDPSGGAGAALGTYTSNYLQFDGFELASSNSNTVNAGGLQAGQSLGNGGGPICCHHLWFINNKVHGYGQAGMQGGQTDFVYVIHNEIYDNAHDSHCPGPQGSGISIYQPTKLSPYTLTADDKNNSVLGNMAYQGDWFRFVFAWNHIHNNYIPDSCNAGYGGITDGNGIIFDDWANSQDASGTGPKIVYAAHGLAMFNVIYNNGSNGIHLFNDTNSGACPSGGGHVVANNSVYNNSLTTINDGTQGYRFDVDEVQSSCNLFINNIAFTISPTGLANNNRALIGANAGGTYAASSFDHNIIFCTGSTCGGNSGAIDGNTSTFTNITSANPTWTNVGNTSTGSETTSPNGINFALQAGSPAIGFLNSQTFLPTGTRDAGACDRSLTVCPIGNATDNFNRANGGLGTNWTTSPSFVAPLIVSNQVSTGASAWAFAYWTANTFASNQSAQITLTGGGGSSAVVRHQAGVSNGYFAVNNFVGAGSTLQIYRMDIGAFTLLASSATITTTVGDVILLTAVGSTFTVFQNGTSVVTATDTTYTGGSPGLAVFNGSLDNWVGGPAQ